VGRRALGLEALTGAALGLEGWELLVAVIVVVLVIGMLGVIALTRNPFRHRVRVGFFVERDFETTPDDNQGGNVSETAEPEVPVPPEPEAEPEEDTTEDENDEGGEES
jgi:hypothetical protein